MDKYYCYITLTGNKFGNGFQEMSYKWTDQYASFLDAFHAAYNEMIRLRGTYPYEIKAITVTTGGSDGSN